MSVLDIPMRIGVINSLIEEDTPQSLTYAALECRLTLEYLCYERFKLSHPYLSSDDLKSWQPKHVVKQISDDINEYVTKSFTVSISSHSVESRQPKTREDYEKIEYIPLGQQSEINIDKVHSLWHGLANVALHIPVPTITSGELEIYGDKEKIKNKVKSVVEFLSGLGGNLLMGGVLGEIYSFNCINCDTLIKKPIKYLSSPTIVNCINPSCIESYLIDSDGQDKKFKTTRRFVRFVCQSCNEDLDVPANQFKELKFSDQLDIQCGSCKACLTVVMRPLVKVNSD